MDEEIIKRWNERVTDEDMVYILGDFSWYNEEQTVEILDRLKGKKTLIRGNHDDFSPRFFAAFEDVFDYFEARDFESGEIVVLSHYPMPCWNGQFKDTVHLYGHVHNTVQNSLCEKFREEIRKTQNLPARMINVGCMMPWIDYTPRTLKEILEGKYTEKQ